MLYPVILAGGSGSRLWPASRTHYPKQFLKLFSDKSLLQETFLRLKGLSFAKSSVVCNHKHRFLVAEHLLEIENSDASIILEPEGKNTAPAIALSALQALEEDDDPILIVLPSDHLIPNHTAFRTDLEKAIDQAKQDKLVAFAVNPLSAETGYGYIQRGEALSDEAFTIASFIEKPNKSQAEELLNSGDYYWNSGMFVFRARVYLDELASHAKEIYQKCQEAFAKRVKDLDFIRVDAKAFSQCPSDSIDYAVMEKTRSAAVVPFSDKWRDLGSWLQVWQEQEKDLDGNVRDGDVITIKAKNNLLKSDKKLMVALGVDNLAVIDSDDALLVAPLSCSQEIKECVSRLEKDYRTERLQHRLVHRPWGSYDSIDQGKRFQVKRLTVKPGEKLSTQKHHHRAEHWIVVKGTAEVKKDNECFMLNENESTYIPIGSVHSLENPGKIPLEIIEVQTGSYLGEDDIVRFADKYQRVSSHHSER